MTFERARTKEQKDIRIAEIVDATIGQYNTMPYEKITLASISKELSFSRVNLYKYFKTKEEIFLKILELDIISWIDNLKAEFIGKPATATHTFAKKWATILYKQKRMLELMSILLSVIEKNSSVKKLAKFKIGYFGNFSDLFLILSAQLPQLSDKEIIECLDMQIIFTMGLYPSSVQSDSQKKAVELAVVDYTPPAFVDTLARFIVTYISGQKRQ